MSRGLCLSLPQQPFRILRLPALESLRRRFDQLQDAPIVTCSYAQSNPSEQIRFSPLVPRTGAGRCRQL
jgi:hypothetical protein